MISWIRNVKLQQAQAPKPLLRLTKNLRCSVMPSLSNTASFLKIKICLVKIVYIIIYLVFLGVEFGMEWSTDVFEEFMLCVSDHNFQHGIWLFYLYSTWLIVFIDSGEDRRRKKWTTHGLSALHLMILNVPGPENSWEGMYLASSKLLDKQV